MKATIFDIQRGSFVDGPGIRTTVFFKGCNLKCKWCHNPESQRFNKEILFYKEKCTGCGKCKTICPYLFEKCDFCGKCELFCPNDARELCGKEYTVEEVLNEILKDKEFYDNSGGGITLSGGECLLQGDFCVALLKSLKEKGVHTAVDTCGFVSKKVLDKVIPFADIFLYDIKAIDEKVHVDCTGHSNKKILENLIFLNEKNAKIEIRIPYVPNYNSSEIEKIAKFLTKIKNVVKIKVLPYHNFAGAKYEALNMENTLPKILPTCEEIESAKKIIKTIINNNSIIVE